MLQDLMRAQDYAVLVLTLNMVEKFINARPYWLGRNDLYQLDTSSQRANRWGWPWNIFTWFLGWAVTPLAGPNSKSLFWSSSSEPDFKHCHISRFYFRVVPIIQVNSLEGICSGFTCLLIRTFVEKWVSLSLSQKEGFEIWRYGRPWNQVQSVSFGKVVPKSKSIQTRLLGLGTKRNLEIWTFLQSGSEFDFQKSGSEFGPATSVRPEAIRTRSRKLNIN